MRRSVLALLLLLAPITAAAEDSDPPRPPAPPVRLLNHLAYGEAERASLAPVASLGGCIVRREMVDDLERMTIAARADGIELRAVSCFRSIEHQRRIFCGGANDCDARAADRARFVGPPGHSEHATGYAVDFAQSGTSCAATEQCFALTPAGKWLMAHAVDYGFELSFPAGNRQGVGWEPWHWRWVGRTSDTREQVRLARARFAAAQASFPALPAVPREIVPQPAPVPAPPPKWIGVAALHSAQFASLR